MYKLIDGRALADSIIEDVAKRIVEDNLEPQLAVVLVGGDSASHIYVNLKEKACERVGIVFHKYLIDEDEKEEKILDTIKFLNNDSDTDAVLIQLPLPTKFNQQKIIDALDYRKDVDGFHKKNIERLKHGKKQYILPGVSQGIWNLIESTGENVKDKEALIISKSDEFRTLTQIILQNNGLCVHCIKPDDPHLAEQAQIADILIPAIGISNSITEDMVKEGAIIIDVGINKKNGKTVGDVDFKNVAPKTAHISPVPGGVGPMTVAMLMYNTMLLAKEKTTKLQKKDH